MKAGAVLFQFFVGNFRSRFLLDYTSQHSFTVEYQRNRCVFHLQLLELFNVRISFLQIIDMECKLIIMNVWLPLHTFIALHLLRSLRKNFAGGGFLGVG